MHDEKMKDPAYEKLCELKKRFMSFVEESLNQGKDSINTNEMGEVIDIVKDLAEAEKYCQEACYYEAVTKAMKEYDDDPRMGYVRTKKMMPYPYYPDMKEDDYYHGPYPEMGNMRMGYPRGESSNTRSGDGRMSRSRDSMGRYTSNDRSGYDDRMMPDDMDHDDRYGRAYKEFRKARRHYTETKSMSDKQEMDEHANEHLADTMQSIREIWESADPTLRKKMKADLQKFSTDLPV